MAPPDVAAGGDDAGPTQRELLMELREHIEGLKATVDAIAKDQALGVTDFTFTLTAHARARGWDAAFGAGVVSVKEGRSGRGERI